MPCSCVVAEDEALLREALVALLARRLAGAGRSSPNARTAAARWRRSPSTQPDVAFLDIRMPGLTGLEVAAAAVEASPRTQVVFVTAYDQYAIDAFERGAVDYLLKPIAPERLAADRAAPAGAHRPAARRPTRGALGRRCCERSATALPRSDRRATAAGLAHRQRRQRETRLILVDDVPISAPTTSTRR